MTKHVITEKGTKALLTFKRQLDVGSAFKEAIHESSK